MKQRRRKGRQGKGEGKKNEVARAGRQKKRAEENIPILKKTERLRERWEKGTSLGLLGGAVEERIRDSAYYLFTLHHIAKKVQTDAGLRPRHTHNEYRGLVPAS